MCNARNCVLRQRREVRPDPGTADEVAAVLAFLLSPDAGYVVGSLLFVDGGGDAAARSDDWPLGRFP